MTIQQYRDDAIKNLELYEMRYKRQDDNFVPRKTARRWSQALNGKDIDLDEIASILREAEQDRDLYDIAFHAFCNDMRQIYRALWEDFLNRSENAE